MEERYRKLLTIYLSATFLSILGLTVASKFIFDYFEGRNLAWWQALLYVVETMTTVGYGSLLPFTHPATVVFTSVVVLFGFGLIFVGLAWVAAHYLGEHFQERPPTAAPSRISNHIIICDYNPLVESLIEELEHLGVPFVIVETDRDLVNELNRRGLTCIYGKPGEAATLEAARIKEARALVADHSDAENASIVLTARAISDIEIYATAEHSRNAKYLSLAGATQVVSPKHVLGENLARWVLSPMTYELIGLTQIIDGLQLCRLPVSPGSSLAGKSLKDLRLREKTGVTAIGYWYRGHFRLIPSPDEKLPVNSVLIVIGTDAQLMDLHANTNTSGRLVRTSHGPCLISGFGDVGQRVAETLEEAKVGLTVISNGDGSPGHPTVIGDATDEAVLISAGIAEASSYVVAVDQDANAIFSTLIARQLNPNLRIVARANSKGAVPDLYQAGADHVLSVSEVGGSILAKLLLPKTQVEVSGQIAFGKLEVMGSLGDKTIAKARISSESGCLVVALIRDGQPVVNPDPAIRLRPGDELILCGPGPALQNCGCQEVLASPARSVV